MKIVIDIPDTLYESIQACKNIEDTDEVTVEKVLIKAVENGTPLPKGHGRIGDLDALRKEISSWGMNDYEPSDFIDEIDNAPTIIDANEEEDQ